MAANIRGMTAAYGPHAWLLQPFMTSTAPKFAGIEWDVLDMPEDWHHANFSRRLMALLERTEEPVILWCCADMFLDRTVSAAALDLLARYVVERGDVVRLGLAEEHYPWEFIEEWEGLQIGRCSDVSRCSNHAGITVDACLFSRDNLLKVLQPRWTIWEIEVRGTQKVLARTDLVSLAVRPGLFHYEQVAHHGGFYWHLDHLLPEDRALLLAAAPRGVKWKP